MYQHYCRCSRSSCLTQVEEGINLGTRNVSVRVSFESRAPTNGLSSLLRTFSCKNLIVHCGSIFSIRHKEKTEDEEGEGVDKNEVVTGTLVG